MIDHSASPFDDYPVERGNDTPTNGNVDLDGTIFDFYHTEDKTRQVGFQYEHEGLESIIYKKGPEAIMYDARKGDYRDLDVLERIIEKIHHGSGPGSSMGNPPVTANTATSEVDEKKISEHRNLAFRWIHVPMNDIRLTIN